MGKDWPALIIGWLEWCGVVAGGERPLTCHWCGIFRSTAELLSGPGSRQAPVGEEEFVPPPGSVAAPGEAASTAEAVGWDQAERLACWEQGCLRSSPWQEEHPGGGKQADSCDSESCYVAAKPCWGCSGHPWVAGHPRQLPDAFGETQGNQAEQPRAAAGAAPGLGSSPKPGNPLAVSRPTGLSGLNFQLCPRPQVL